jgi:hypothetical protein
VIPSFSNLLDRLKGIFSQDFLLVGLFPTLLFTALSLAWAYWTWPATRWALDAAVQQTPTRQLPYWLAGTLILVVVAFVLWSLNPAMRRFLEGELLLPSWVRRWLESRQQKDWLRLEGERCELQRELFALRKVHQDRRAPWAKQLREACPSEPDLAPAGYRVPEALLAELAALEALRAKRALIPFAQLESAFNRLLAELRWHSANELVELDTLRLELKSLAKYALDRVESDYQRLETTIRSHYPEEAVRLSPSRMGNVGQLYREYCFARYGVDVELLWPRLLKIARDDPAFYPMLEGAKTQLDFAVVMSFISTLFTLVWSLLTLLWSPALAPYFTIVLAGPFSIYLFYRLAVANYQAFGVSVKSAVDLFRFDLLEDLHLELPADNVAERVLWEHLERVPDPTADEPLLKYRHAEHG